MYSRSAREGRKRREKKLTPIEKKEEKKKTDKLLSSPGVEATIDHK